MQVSVPRFLKPIEGIPHSAIGIFTFVVSTVVWLILKGTTGIRVSEEAEVAGLDTAELGMEAYPDFTKG